MPFKILSHFITIKQYKIEMVNLIHFKIMIKNKMKIHKKENFLIELYKT